MFSNTARSAGLCSGKTGRLAMALVMLLVLPALALANPASIWEHRYNPALLSTSNRNIFETAVSASPSLQNSYLTVGQVFQETLRINLDELYDGLTDAGFGIGLSLGAGVHSTVHLLGLGLGAYADLSSIGQIWIPKSLFDVAANGFETGRTYTGESGLLVRSFAEYGAYGSLKLSNDRLRVGVKLAKFLPLAYTGEASTAFTVFADQDGSTTATADVSAQLYSAFDIENPRDIDPSTLLSDPGSGLKFDLGFVYGGTRKKPRFGMALTNLTLKPAVPAFGWNYGFSASATVKSDPLQALIDEDSEEPYSFTDPVSNFEAVDTSGTEIKMPLTLSAFYRFSGLRIVDIIPNMSLVMDDPFRMNAGVLVEGAIFPLSLLSLGMSYQDLAWRTSAGLKLNLHLIELGVNVSSSSPEFATILKTNGLAVDVKLAIGL